MLIASAIALSVATAAQAQTPSAYLKSGPVFSIANGPFESTNLGWSIASGLRQPILPPFGGGYVFCDIGGSYLSVTGRDEGQPTAGNLLIISPDPFVPPAPVPLDNLVEAELREIRRGSFDVAIGFHGNPPRFNAATGSLFQWMVRGGGRVGHIHGVFRERLSAEAQAQIAMLPPGFGFDATPNFSKNDTFGGMFVGFGSGITFASVDTLVFGPLDITLGTEAEFSYDWIDFRNYQDTGLGTAALLFNITISR